MIATSKGHTNVVRQLLACTEIGVNAQTEQRATALMLAASEGHVDIVE